MSDHKRDDIQTQTTGGDSSGNASREVTSLPKEIIVRHQHGCLLKTIAIAGWLLAACVIVYAVVQNYRTADYLNKDRGIKEQFHSGNQSATDKIAIITVAGVIQDGHGYVKRQIDRVRDDKNIKAVVVRINSPGGTVSGSDYIFHHLKRLRQERDLPIVVSMGGIAASGGYYISMSVGDQEDSIFAEPTTTTGSIGVIIPHYNVAGLLEDYKIEDDSIMSHPRKDILSVSKRLSDDERKLLEEYIDQAFERFKRIILEGRPKYVALNQQDNVDGKNADGNREIAIHDLKTDRDLATGEVFSAETALEFGLVDRIGFLEAAIERAAELGGIDLEDTRVIKYAAPAPWIDLPYLNKSGAASATNSPAEFAAANLFEMSTPRAYYLASSFPALANSTAEYQGQRDDEP